MKQLRAREMAPVSFLLPMASVAFPETWALIWANLLLCSEQVFFPHTRLQLSIWKLMNGDTPHLFQLRHCLQLRVWCRRASVLPWAEEWGRVLDTQVGTGIHASGHQLLSSLPRDSCRTGWVMQRCAGHPLRQMGSWGAHGHSHGPGQVQAARAHCHLPDQHSLFFYSKNVNR